MDHWAIQKGGRSSQLCIGAFIWAANGILKGKTASPIGCMANSLWVLIPDVIWVE